MFHQSFAQTPEFTCEEEVVQPLFIELNDEDLTEVNGSCFGGGWGGCCWSWSCCWSFCSFGGFGGGCGSPCGGGWGGLGGGGWW